MEPAWSVPAHTDVYGHVDAKLFKEKGLDPHASLGQDETVYICLKNIPRNTMSGTNLMLM